MGYSGFSSYNDILPIKINVVPFSLGSKPLEMTLRIKHPILFYKFDFIDSFES